MASKKSSEIAVSETVEQHPELFVDPSVVWENVERLDTLNVGAILETKARLVGVPIIVASVTYRPGAYRRPGEILTDDYVSLECFTPPESSRLWDVDRIRRVRENVARDMDGQTMSDLRFDVNGYVGPNDYVVVNDSSTGIKRQITGYLAHKSLIAPETKDGVLPPLDDLRGHMGECIYDQNSDEWASGKEHARKGIKLQGLFCRQGLRISAYETGATFYLA